MKCEDCALWIRHTGNRNQPLEKGTCCNRQFKGRRDTPQITSSNTRCASGKRVKQKNEPRHIKIK